MIAVQEAIKAAKQYVIDLYAEEKIDDVLLEEVRRDNDAWLITIGFRDPSADPYRTAIPIDVDDDGTAIFDVAVPKEGGFVRWPRVYKVVRIDCSGRAVEMVNRAA